LKKPLVAPVNQMNKTAHDLAEDTN